MKKFKIISLILAVMMFVSLFSACGNTGKSTETDSKKTDTTTRETTKGEEDKKDEAKPEVKKEKVTLDFWHLWPDNDVDMTRIVKEWNEKNGNEIEVKALGNAVANKQLAAIAAGEGPDISHSQWVNVPIWGKQGAMEPLNKYIDSDPAFDKDDFVKGAWERCMYDGKVYILPFEAMTMILYYNKDLLAEAGYDHGPATIEELVEMAIKTTKFDAEGNITQLGLKVDFPWRDDCAWPIAFGAKWVDEKGRLTFNSPDMIAAYQWMADYNKEIGLEKINKFASGFGDGPNEPFTNGKLVMCLNGDWHFGTIKDLKPDMNFGVTFPPPPAAKKETLGGTGLIGFAGFYINPNSKHKDEAWKFLSYLCGKEQMAKTCSKENPDFTTRVSALKAYSTSVHPLKKQVADMMAADKLQGFACVPYLNKYLTKIYEQMTAAVEGKKTVEEAAKAVQAALEPDANLEMTGKK